MVVSVQTVLRHPLLQQAQPIIVGGKHGMNRVVRWAYTHERYDINQFLIGEELLIIEGSELAKHTSDTELHEYIDSLNQKHVSGLVVELVDFFTEIPEPLISRADEIGLPLIGLRKRVPFVALCQTINSLIMSEQMESHTSIRNLAHELKLRFSRSQSVQDIAAALHQLIGERVQIITPDGHTVADSNCDASFIQYPDTQHLCERTHYLMIQENGADQATHKHKESVFTITHNGFVIATIVLSQQLGYMTDQVRSIIVQSLESVLPSLIAQQMRMKMMMRILPYAEIHDPNTYVTIDYAEELIQALLGSDNVSSELRGIGFIIECKQINRNNNCIAALMQQITQAIARFQATPLLYYAQDYIIGLALCNNASLFPTFYDTIANILRASIANQPEGTQRKLRILQGSTTIGISHSLRAHHYLRYIARHALSSQQWRWGAVSYLHDFAYQIFMGQTSSEQTVQNFIHIFASPLIHADNVYIQTLCSLGDHIGNKTACCESLQIQRQTLYSRLERIEKLTGLSQHQTADWSLLILGAQFIRQQRSGQVH